MEKAVHFCFGNYGGQTIQRGTWKALIDFLNRLHADHLVLELAHRPPSDLDALKALDPRLGIGVGVVDIKANHIETVSVLQKTDGTNEWQTKGIETTPEGDFIALWGGGTGKATGPTTQQWEGQIQFMTQSRRLSWLNGTKAWVEGEGDAAKGEFHGKWYRLT